MQELPLCQCGCGLRVTKPGNRFLKGHTRYWKGKTLPDYVKAKISKKLSGKNNPFYGRKHTEETKKKISEANKGKGLGRVPWNKGLKGYMSEETIKKISEKIKERWKDENYRKQLSEIHSQYHHSEETRKKMSEIAKQLWESGVRDRESHRLRLLGPRNPNWQGGISKEPYCAEWTEWLKEQIKERDGYRCQNPDCYGNCSELTVHHIDYDKKNCSPDNLITLCKSCNSRANSDRDFWKFLYGLGVSFFKYGDGQFQEANA